MPYEFRSYHIADTAVKADVTRQDPSATLWVSHYFDQDNQCLDCNRRFIFFAIEQKYWYETLRLSLDADCVRCVPCRKKRREPQRENSRYQELLDQPERNDADLLELIDLYLSLVKRGRFTCKRLDRVRRFAKSLSEKARSGKRHARQMKLLGQLEKGSPGS